MQQVQVVEPAFTRVRLPLGRRTRPAQLSSAQFAVVLFLVYFFLVTGDLYKRKIVKIAGPTLSKKKITVQILDEINQQIASFIRVQVFTSLVVAVATAVGAVVVRRAAVTSSGGCWPGSSTRFRTSARSWSPAASAVVAFMQFDDLS